MKTRIIKLDPDNIVLSELWYAAEVLKSGGLVAFPTETVYGLGANALNEDAVKKIFEAKGRPSDNPLIVHIADKSGVSGLVDLVPSNASRLMDEFWPGPLTLVMGKSGKVPGIITAGLDTVGIRMPSHPVALALIKAAGIPVAAPSANTSGKPSPTHAKHVIDDLSGKVDVIIDAGASNVGLESTVLDVTVNPPLILRPGGITPLQLELVLGKVEVDPALKTGITADAAPKAPGMKYTHYSPKADVIVIEGAVEKVVEWIKSQAFRYAQEGIEVGVLSTEQTRHMYKNIRTISAGDRDKPETIAANLFNAFRKFDDMGVGIILAEAVDNTGIGFAIMNRMSKAAGYNIVKV